MRKTLETWLDYSTRQYIKKEYAGTSDRYVEWVSISSKYFRYQFVGGGEAFSLSLKDMPESEKLLASLENNEVIIDDWGRTVVVGEWTVSADVIRSLSA